MKKKNFLVASAILLLLAGCGPTDSNTDSSKESKKGNEEYDLLVWEDQQKSKGTEEAIEKFEKDNDVKIKVVEKAYAQNIEDLRLDGPAGTGADVIAIPGDQIGTAVTEGLLKEIEVDEETQNSFTDSAMQSQIIDEKVYGLPYAVETQLLFYNKDIVSEEEVPTTLGEWYDYSLDRTSSGKDQYGLIATFDQLYYAYEIINGYGGYIFNTDEKGNFDATDIGLANEGAIEGADIIKKFYDEKVFPSGIIGEQGTNTLDSLFTEGKAAAVISGPWAIDPYKEAGINYGVKELPMLDNGEHMSSFIGVKSYNVSSYSKNPDLAEKLVKFLSNEENQKTRYEITQEIPAVESLSDDPILNESESAVAIAEQSKYAELTPNITEMNQVWESYDAALQTIASGKADPKEALAEGVSNIESAIAANK